MACIQIEIWTVSLANWSRSSDVLASACAINPKELHVQLGHNTMTLLLLLAALLLEALYKLVLGHKILG